MELLLDVLPFMFLKESSVLGKDLNNCDVNYKLRMTELALTRSMRIICPNSEIKM